MYEETFFFQFIDAFFYSSFYILKFWCIEIDECVVKEINVTMYISVSFFIFLHFFSFKSLLKKTTPKSNQKEWKYALDFIQKMYKIFNPFEKLTIQWSSWKMSPEVSLKKAFVFCLFCVEIFNFVSLSLSFQHTTQMSFKLLLFLILFLLKIGSISPTHRFFPKAFFLLFPAHRLDLNSFYLSSCLGRECQLLEGHFRKCQLTKLSKLFAQTSAFKGSKSGESCRRRQYY